MNDVQAKIQSYEKTIQTATMMKVRAETQMQQLQDERDKMLAELQQLGIEEEELPAKIRELDEQIAADIQKLDEWEQALKEVLG